MIENLKDLETLLKLPEGALKTAIESAESVKVEIPELEVFTKSDYSARIENLKTTFQKQGQDFMIKEFKEKKNLDFEGKGLDKLIEVSIQNALQEAKIEPDAKSKNYLQDIEKLQSNLSIKDKEIEELKMSFESKENDRYINDYISKKINFETSIPKEDVISLLRAKMEFKKDGDNILTLKNGEILKNQTTLNPLSLDEALIDVLPAYAKQVTGGKGAGDQTGQSKTGTMESFNQEMESKGVALGSADYSQELSARISNKTLQV
jgi:hypothetical protein